MVRIICLLALLGAPGCTPLVIGGAAALTVDTLAEQDGDDGIF